jgi:hypothetical protein
VIEPRTCPLCGEAGQPVFTGFACRGPATCPNAEPRKSSDIVEEMRQQLQELDIMTTAWWP